MSKIYLGVIAGEAAVALFVWEKDTEMALCKKCSGQAFLHFFCSYDIIIRRLVSFKFISWVFKEL